MTLRAWNSFVGSAPGAPETVAAGAELTRAIQTIRSTLHTNQQAAIALQNYLDMSWLGLAQQEQADVPAETEQSRARRLATSIAQRALLQRISADLFIVTGLNQQAGMPTPSAEETPHTPSH